MNVLFHCAAGLFLLLVKTTFLMPVPGLGRVFEPLLLLTLYLGLFRPGFRYAATAVYLGYLIDIFSGSRFGFHMILTSAIFFLAGFLRGRFFLEGKLFQGVCAAGMILVHDMLALAVFALISAERHPGIPLDFTLTRMLFNGFAAVYLFRWLGMMENRLAPLVEHKAAGVRLE